MAQVVEPEPAIRVLDDVRDGRRPGPELRGLLAAATILPAGHEPVRADLDDLPAQLCAFTAGLMRVEAAHEPGHYEAGMKGTIELAAS